MHSCDLLASMFKRVAHALLFVPLATYALPGDLDTAGFGTGTGTVVTTFGANSSQATAVVVQPDRKIVVAGFCRNGTISRFCLARYLNTGVLDPSFHSVGTLIATLGSTNDAAIAVAVQPDGKIVAAGYCFNGFNDDFCMTRVLPSGQTDTGFGTAGIVITPLGAGHDIATAMTIQPDGRILVAGYCYNGTNNDFCLARYLSNGQLDSSFGTAGKVNTSIGSVNDYATAIALQSGGEILVAGRCSNGTNDDFCLARYLANGSVDFSLGGTGKVITPIGSDSDGASAVAVQPDGKIVLGGTCYNGADMDFCLLRYASSGVLDTTFAGTGKVITPIGVGSDFVSAMSLQYDGKIVVSGRCYNGSSYNFCLARYLPSGALDPGFNNTGKVVTPTWVGDERGLANAIQPDGKIIVAGACDTAGGGNPEFCVARYLGGPFDAQNCSMDIDGDNRVLATVDSLLHARIALGLSGPAVLNGISFPATATRTTWPQIRDYLVNQCGMSIVP